MLAIALVTAIAIAFFSQRSGSATRVAEEQRSISQEVLRLNSRLLETLEDAETSQRGFLLTGNDLYLQPYQSAIAEIPRVLERFRVIAKQRPDIATDLKRLDPLIAAKLSALETTIDLRRANRLSEALQVVDTARGAAYMEQVRLISGRIDQIAQRRQAMFEAEAWSSVRTLRIFSTGGSVLLAGFLVVATITIFSGMRRRDELARKALAGEKLLATTLSGIADGVIATDAQAHISFINPVAQNLTGWSGQEATGVPINDVFVIVNETTRVRVDNPLEKAIAQGVVMGLANHTNLISRSGTDIPINDSAAPLRDEDGNIMGAVIVFRDISERRRAEDQLRASNAELQQFVDGAAHDLRAPLNSVTTLTQLLDQRLDTEVGPEARRVIGYIADGIERMQRLLEDLLQFARASHFDERSAKLLSFDAAVQSAIQNLKTLIDQTGAEVIFDSLPVVPVHETHAIQLLQNLIGNAIKYRSADRPRVQIRAEKHDSEWLISVADNGIGIGSQYVETVFMPFKRLHTDQAYPGSGIGLATCRKIVSGYGGRIWAESEPGKGSTFKFTLPAVESDAIRGASA
jgi:PAS domain S-box-containing protein